ncbi:MAG: fibronectin type III-like domain-contianing protein, partial [Acholeplasmatales bacterium]|nr:fibronectin type III-like domain-contianing protein [Acholeplasmatales bacterium]
VKNTGNHLGKAVPQVYLSCPDGKLDKPYQQLVAFEKTSNLNPGDEEEITLTFDIKNEASYDSSRNCYVLEKGTYLIRLGYDSANTSVVATVSIPMDIITNKVNPIFENHKDIIEIDPKARKKPSWHNDLGLEIIDEVIITAKDIIKENHTPELIGERAWEIVNKLEVKELIDVVVGTGMTHFSYKNIFTLPGSVGNTTPRLLHKGITNIAMCDGPAGLRVSRRSVLVGNKIKTLENVHEVLNYVPKGLQKMLLGNEKKGQKLYQYATAFPVSNAMGQTWNKVCLELQGIAIAKEMIEFGCGYWLPPGMNIHRNPLCGRNFEYYSEDPHLTGALASAIVKGVQSIDGAYATIKHFCCNNQEYLRNTSSSNLNERALREIYLKPFKMVIEAANAKSVMTCYNRVNGVYPSNHKPLIDGFLREECGFNGVVMTDWMATSKKFADPAKCIHAGNDLIMPGGGYDRKSIQKALKKGTITLDEVKLCAARIVDAINNSYRVKYDDPKQK